MPHSSEQLKLERDGDWKYGGQTSETALYSRRLNGHVLCADKY